MKNIILLITIFFLGTSFSHAQKIDRLLKKRKYEKAIEYSLKQKLQTEKEECYSKIATSYFKDKNYKKAIEFYIKGKNKKGYKSANEKQGDYEFKSNKYLIAAKYFIEANNKEKLISAYIEQGNLEFRNKSFLKAAEYYKKVEKNDRVKLSYQKQAEKEFETKNYIKSIEYFKKAKDEINIIKAYGKQATLEFENKNYLQAIEYFKLAKDTVGYRKSKKYLGLQYMNDNKYSDAINCFKEINDTGNLKKTYRKYAKKKYSDNDYSQAVRYFSLSNDKSGIYKSYMAMANIAYANKRFKKALNYLDECKNIYPNRSELLNKIEQYSNFITDSRDGKNYATVKIGNQWWMAENMAYYSKNLFEEYRDANMPRVDYRTDNYKNIYGYLYSFKVAKKVCPSGWHLPSHEEWKELEVYLGMSKKNAEGDSYLRGYEIVGKLLSTSYLWKKGYGSEKITNSTGFNVLPGGYGWFKHKPDPSGGLNISYYSKVGEEACFWSSSEFRKYDHSNFYEAITRTFRTQEIRVGRDNIHNQFNSVRCVKD